MPEKSLKLNINGLDWFKISETLMNLKSPEECLIQWVFYDHPSINNQPWDTEELEHLGQVVSSVQSLSYDVVDYTMNVLIPTDTISTNSLKEALGKHQWQIIADKHGNNRTAIRCFMQYQRFLNKTHLRKYE